MKRHVTRFVLSSVAVTALCLPGLLPTNAFAADKPADTTTKDTRQRPGQRPGMMFEQYEQAINKLDLTDDQKTKIKEVFADIKTKAEELRKEAEQIPADQRREKMGGKFQELMKDAREKVDAILTPEQVEKLKSELQRNMGGGGPIERIMAVAGKLDLTDEQKTKIKELASSYREKSKAVRDEAGNDRAALLEKMGKLAEEFRADLTQILTADQAAKLKTELEADRAKGPDAGGAGERPARRQNQ